MAEPTKIRADLADAAPVGELPIARRGGGSDDGGMSNERLAALEARFDAVVPTLATRADLGELRVEIHKMDASIKTWMIATVVGLMIGFGGLFLAMTNALKPAPAWPGAPSVSGTGQTAAPAPAASTP